MNLEEARETVLQILKSQGKVKNSDMIQALGGDAALFDLVREDLIFNDLAEDKKNVGLIYTGGGQPVPVPRKPGELSAEPNPNFPVLPDKPERPAPRRATADGEKSPARSGLSPRERAQADFASSGESRRMPPDRKEVPDREPQRREGFPAQPGKEEPEGRSRPGRETPPRPVREGSPRRERELPARPGREGGLRAEREHPARPVREPLGRPGREGAQKPASPKNWDPFKGSNADSKGGGPGGRDQAWNAASGEPVQAVEEIPAVHLCFSRQEKAALPLAGRIERDLAMRGMRVWSDRQEFAPGDVIVPLITCSSWEHDGADFWDRILDAQCLSVRVIPVLFADGFLNLNLFHLGWVDFNGWEDGRVYTMALGHLLNAINNPGQNIPSPCAQIFEVLKPFNFIAEAACNAHPFIGREWVLRTFNKWMENANSRVFCIVGGKGAGKSAILSFLTCRYPNAATLHICKRNWPETLQPQRVIASLAAQLATRYPQYRSALEAQGLYRTLLNALSQEAGPDSLLCQMDADRLFRTLIGEPLRFEHPKSPLLFIFDDLDECSLSDDVQSSLLQILQNGFRDFPGWARLVFSVSKGSETWETFHGFNPEVVDLSMPENFQDAQSLITARFNREPLNELLEQKDADAARLGNMILKKTGGNFYHIVRVLEALENEWLDAATPETIPDQIFPLFQYAFDNYVGRNEFDVLRSIIEILFAARAPLQARQVAYFLDGNAREIEADLDKISTIISCWNGVYAVRHTLVFEWLTGQAGAAHPYRINLTLGHRRIAEKLLNNHTAGKRDAYLLGNLIYHLIGAQRIPELFKTFSSYTYIQACLSSGRYAQMMAEFPVVIQAIEKVNDSASAGKIQWLKLLQGTLHLAMQDVIQDRSQLPGQIIGRLSAFENFESINTYIVPFLNEIRSRKDAAAWIYPLKPSLIPPGGVSLRTLNGHSGKITQVILSPDGKRIFSASEDSTVRGWDLERGTALFHFTGHTKKVNAIAISPNGQRLVSASHDKLLKVWDLQSGKELGTLQGHTSYVNAVVIAPDGTQAISASADTTLRVWNINGSISTIGGIGPGRETKILKGHTDSVDKIVLTPEGRRAISASADKTIRVWDLENGEVIHVLRGHQSIITILSVLPDGRRLASGSIEDHSLKIWDIVSGRLLYTLRGHTNFISGFCITPDGRFAVTSSGDRTLKIWLMPPMMMNGQDSGAVEIHTLKGHSSYVRAVALMADGERLISGSADKTIKVWNMQTGQAIRTLTGHTEGVNTVLLNPEGNRLVSASIDNTIRVWDISAGLEIGLDDTIQPVMAPGHSDTVNALCVAPDGWRALSASSDGSVKVWNFSASFQGGGSPLYVPGAESQVGRLVNVFEGHKSPVMCATLTPDGRKAVSAGAGIKVWALESCVEILNIESADMIYAVTVTHDGNWIVAGSSEHTLKVWDLDSGRFLGALGDYHDRASWVRALALSPDGKRIFSGSIDKTIKVWDLRSGKEIGLMRGHIDKITSLAVTPDGRAIISASEDGTIKLWSGETFRETGTLHGHKAPVRSIAISRDGRRLVSASDDLTIKVWNLGNGKEIASTICDGKMNSCAVSADGSTILAAGYTGRVHFLRLVENPTQGR